MAQTVHDTLSQLVHQRRWLQKVRIEVMKFRLGWDQLDVTIGEMSIGDFC